MISLTFREKVIWLAVWMEGEGSFYANPSSCSARLVSSQVQSREPLDKLHSWFGGSVRSRKIEKPRERVIYTWQIGASKAAGLAMMIFPMMSSRRQNQIRKMLNTWKMIPTENKFRTHCPKGYSYSGANLIGKWPGRRACRICMTEGGKKYWHEVGRFRRHHRAGDFRETPLMGMGYGATDTASREDAP